MANKPRLLIALFVTGALVVGLGSSVFSAGAKPRTFVLTLLGHVTRTVTLDLPVETPLDQVHLPGLKLPLLSIQEITPPDAPGQGPLLSIKPGTPNQQAAAPAQQAPEQAAAPAAKAHKVGRKRAGRLLQTALSTADRLVRAVKHTRAIHRTVRATRLRQADGTPAPYNPTFSLALPGPAPVGVPNFFIDKFAIPPFLLPIYQAAGVQYGIRWEVLAAINEIETDYGRNLNVSSKGAIGWMQFIPSSWRRYGVDANGDGRKDPYNPVDAIFAAARYLRAAGADTNLPRAVFAYNHADWYVQSVLLRARLIGGLPADLVGSLSGLTQGQFPVHATATYADDLRERSLHRRVARGANAAIAVNPNRSRHGINIYAKAGAVVDAVQDGTVVRIGKSRRLGRFLKLRDVYGNTYTYANLGSIARHIAVAKERSQSQASVTKELALPVRDPAPAQAASAGRQAVASVKALLHTVAAVPAAATKAVKERLFANPARPQALSNGGRRQIADTTTRLRSSASLRSYFTNSFGLTRSDVVLKRLVVGRRVIAGAVLGHIGASHAGIAPHILFEIRPAGRGAPRIDPKPILDGWKLLESTAIYRAQGTNPLLGGDAGPSIGQILLMSKQTLQQAVLGNPRIDIYSCGRRDIAAGAIDRRVLATLEFLAASGLRPTVSTLRCGHSYYTTSGNVSEHSSGNAVDIAKINGIPILGNQGAGSIADITIRRLLTLQGNLKPHQIISLMTYQGTDNTLALPDHADHIHVGFAPEFDPASQAARDIEAVLKPSQWIKLIGRISQIQNPTLSAGVSKYAIRVPAPARASRAHTGE